MGLRHYKDKAVRAEVLSQQRAIRRTRQNSLSQLRLDSYFRDSVGDDSGAAAGLAGTRALSRFQRSVNTERRAAAAADSEEESWDDSDGLDCSSEDEQFSY